jgi:hypothetical protein
MLKTEAYYGANIIKQIMTNNDFSDATNWQLFEPDLDLPRPYVLRGVLIDPAKDWNQDEVSSYFQKKKQRLLDRYEEKKRLNAITRPQARVINNISRSSLPLYMR